MEIFVVGKNQETQFLCKRWKVLGIVDDFAAPGSDWNGVPLVKVEELPEVGVVVNASSSIAPISVQRRIATAKPNVEILSYYEFRKKYDAHLPQQGFVRDWQGDYALNGEKWERVRGLFVDERSREIWDQVTRYWATGDIDNMKDFHVCMEEQYFEDFVHVERKKYFVDCGGFDGDTALAFIKRNPNYQKIWLIEANEINIKKARANLQEYSRVIFIPCALGEKKGYAAFCGDWGSASAICAEGTKTVCVERLDDILDEKPDFIKMDIEGSEVAALRGSAEIIQRYKPTMAIACYHRARHFWEIPEVVLGMRGDYKVSFRHYTEGWSESVLYFW